MLFFFTFYVWSILQNAPPVEVPRFENPAYPIQHACFERPDVGEGIGVAKSEREGLFPS